MFKEPSGQANHGGGHNHPPSCTCPWCATTAQPPSSTAAFPTVTASMNDHQPDHQDEQQRDQHDGQQRDQHDDHHHSHDEQHHDVRDPNDHGTAVTWEEHPWRHDPDEARSMSNRARRSTRGPYKAAITPKIAERHIHIPADALTEAEDALIEITRFDTELSNLLPGSPDGSPGELGPLASVLLRTESAASSEIENVTAGAKALALAAIEEKSGTNAVLVTGNVNAMRSAIDMADDLSVDTILAAHRTMLDGHAYAQPGQFRDGQVWIGGRAPSPHTAFFVPPHRSWVPAAMDDLMAFCDRTDMPVLPHAAIAHAQFETIHPFADGNGRTGRALVHAMLRRSGATRRITVPVSAGLLADTSTYFDALTAYRDGDTGPIVTRFADASFAAVDNGRTLARDLANTYATWESKIRARSDSGVWKVMPHLVAQPAVTVRHIQQQTGASYPAAQNAIDHLVNAGVLAPASASRRNRVWIAEDVITALDDFAARAIRR